MVDYEIFKKIAKDLEGVKESPFEQVGLKADIRIVNPSELTELMVGYEKHSEKLIFEIGKTINSETKKNKRIAIIGPQGSGKTTLTMDLIESLQEQQSRGSVEFIKKIEFVQALPLRFFIDGNVDFLELVIKRSKKNNVFLFDDAQELFFSEEKKDGELFENLNKKLDNMESSISFFTFNTFGWKIALSKTPDLIDYFDEIIWIDGLENGDLKEAIDKRLNHFSINCDDKISTKDLFESDESIDKILNYSFDNPRLAIGLISSCIVESLEMKNTKIKEETVDKVLNDEGIDQCKTIGEKLLIKNKVLYYMLSYPKMSIKKISKFTGLDRTTIQRDLTEQIKFKRVFKNINPKNKREYLYGIKKIIRALLEKTLMDRLEKQVESVKSWK